MNSSFDVIIIIIIIIGAGPAGSTCALALAKAGLNVALLEKSTFPRDKVCSDAIPPYVPKVLHTINPELKNRYINYTAKEPVKSVHFIAPSQEHMDLTLGEMGGDCKAYQPR